MNEKWEGIKRVVKTKVFIILVVFVVMSFVVLFPHTKTTKINSELTGVFVTQKENYLFHTRVGFQTEYLCMSDAGTKSFAITYGLNGDIKSKSTSYCDGTSEAVTYNMNGTKRSLESVSFVGDNIRYYAEQFDKYGLLLSQTTELNGITTSTLQSFDDSNILLESSIITTDLEMKIYEKTSTFDIKGRTTESTIGTWENGLPNITIKNVYTEGIISGITYIDEPNNMNAQITCIDDTGCILVKLTADQFTVQFNTTEFNYDLFVDGETGSSKIFFTQLQTSNIPDVLNEIEGKVQAILNAQTE